MAKETLEKRLRKASSMQDVFSIFHEYKVKVKVGNQTESKEYQVVKSLEDGVLLCRAEKKHTGPRTVESTTIYAVMSYYSNIMMMAEISRVTMVKTKSS